MEFALVVVRAFGSHRLGDLINQEEAICSVLAGEHANCVVKVVPAADATRES